MLCFLLCQQTSGGTNRRCWYTAGKEDPTRRHAVIAEARVDALLVSLHVKNVCGSSVGAPAKAKPLEGERSSGTSWPMAPRLAARPGFLFLTNKYEIRGKKRPAVELGVLHCLHYSHAFQVPFEHSGDLTCFVQPEESLRAPCCPGTRGC